MLARRTQLGLRAADVIERAGPGLSSTVLSHIENSKQISYAIRTVSALERALGWMPNSILRILDGGEPEEVWVPPSRVIRHGDQSTDTVPMPESPPVVVQERADAGPSVLPPEWDERFAALEHKIAELKDKLAREQAERAAERAERERLSLLFDEMATRLGLEPWRTVEPDPDNEDEMFIWSKKRRTKEWKQQIIWAMRHPFDNDNDQPTDADGPDDADEPPSSARAG